MKDEVAHILAITGPTLSSTLVQRLVQQGFTQDAARKRVSRARGAVRRLEGVIFPNREQFLFLAKQLDKRDFRQNLSSALQETRTSYGRGLVALKARRGALPAEHFSAAAGLPVENAKGQISSSRVLGELQKVGLVTITRTLEGEVIGLRDSPLMSKRRRAALIVEDVALSALRPWLVNLGWTSSKALTIRAPKSSPKFGQYRFDLVGPTYLSALTEFCKKKVVNGFIVGDILLDRNVTLRDLEPFFAKLAVLWSQKRSTRFQPMFIGDRFYPDALKLLRSKGCLVARPETIFGVEIAKQLRELIRTIERAAEEVTKDPNSVFRLIAKIAKLEGSSLNLRGVVLELIVAHLFRLDGYSIDIRRQVRSIGGDLAEIDVQASKKKELVCVECKGKSPGVMVGLGEIESWINKTIPRIKSWLKGRDDTPAKRLFEFYASTGYDDEALAFIREFNESSSSQGIRFHNGDDVISKLRENSESSLIEIFREHFRSD